MPTIPPDTPAPHRPEPHRHRRLAESFGIDAARYDRARPRYPEAMVAAFHTASPGPRALDVGCGTGIASRQFKAAGWDVLGVEPDPRMAAFAAETGVPVEVATFEDWDPRGRDFDAVIAATAWHWVDPASGAAKAARLLRPGGLLGLAWTVAVPPAELSAAAAAVLRRVMPDSPLSALTRQPGVDEYRPILDSWADHVRGTRGFGEPRLARYDWRQEYTREQWLDLLPTQGGLTRLPAEALAELTTEVGAAVDGLGGSFTMDYAALTVTATRRHRGA